jgi:uncharacterized protein
MKEHKILFTGSVGAGKTTAIGAVSEIEPLSTDVRNHDASVSKDLTTVGLDYGELTLDNGDKLRLYGTPGQARFDFMWQILARGALGVIVLVDHTKPDPLAEMAQYLQGFAELIANTGAVVAIGRFSEQSGPSLDDYAERAASMGVMCPVLTADVRVRDEVVQLLELLLTQLESRMEWS